MTPEAAFQLLLAGAVAGAYFTIAAVLVPRIQLEGASPRFERYFRWGAVAFFVGCGLTHSHIAGHAIGDPQDVELHEIGFHLLQAVGGWLFIFAAIKTFDVKLVRRKSGQELAAEELKLTNLQLQRSNRELERFASIVSHDLKEPLRTVAGFSGLLQQRYAGQLDERADEYIRHTTEASERMAKLLDGLLEFSQVSGGELTAEPVDMGALVDQTLRSLAAQIEERGVKVERGELATVYGDVGQLGQLLQNLVQNAIKFGPPNDGRILITASQQNGDWLFTVADNGIGIDPSQAERVFEMFSRLHARDEYPGTGAGLGICAQIVARHGGRIWVDPGEGGGSAFRFTLPATPVDVPQGGTPETVQGSV